MNIVRPPYSPDQIASFNAFQESGCFHEYTCGHDHRGDYKLVAMEDGLYCPSCAYKQEWAAGFLMDWSWQAQALLIHSLRDRCSEDRPTVSQETEGHSSL